MKRPTVALGRHWLIEFSGARHLGDMGVVERTLREAVRVSGVTLIRLELHHFGAGQGITAMAMLAESHVSIHTWPEHAFAAIDIFMCGPASRPDLALEALQAALEPGTTRVRRFNRGRPAAD